MVALTKQFSILAHRCDPAFDSHMKQKTMKILIF